MQLFVLPTVLLVWSWLVRLGGPGLILIGIADNSVVPLTGSMDVLTIWLAAAHRNLWPFYALMATIGGFLAISRGGIQGDPGWVVIDEFAGQWITLLALHRPTPIGLLLAFVLFRLLDITKLGPVGWADRQHGPFGIMADDVIAGAVAALLLAITDFVWPGLLNSAS